MVIPLSPEGPFFRAPVGWRMSRVWDTGIDRLVAGRFLPRGVAALDRGGATRAPTRQGYEGGHCCQQAERNAHSFNTQRTKEALRPGLPATLLLLRSENGIEEAAQEAGDGLRLFKGGEVAGVGQFVVFDGAAAVADLLGEEAHIGGRAAGVFGSGDHAAGEAQVPGGGDRVGARGESLLDRDDGFGANGLHHLARFADFLGRAASGRGTEKCLELGLYELRSAALADFRDVLLAFGASGIAVGLGAR